MPTITIFLDELVIAMIIIIFLNIITWVSGGLLFSIIGMLTAFITEALIFQTNNSIVYNTAQNAGAQVNLTGDATGFIFVFGMLFMFSAAMCFGVRNSKRYKMTSV